jgi:hypothetical protein
MPANARFTRGTVNEALSQGDHMAHAQLSATGFKSINNPSPSDLTQANNYNGGLYARRISRVQKGDILFRFSDSRRTSLEEQFSGLWWFDQDCFATIRRTSRMQNADFTETARTLLGVLYEWGDMRNFVGGRLTADFWCFKGLTGAVSGERQRMSGHFRDDVVQIFVPGGLTLTYFEQSHDNLLQSGIV